MLIKPGLLLTAVLLAASVSACSDVDAPGAGETGSTVSPAAGSAPPPAADAPAGAEPKTVADIFPAGAHREAVLNTCGSCHNVACAAIGQRSAERWDALRAGHKDHVSSGDLNAMFDYLKANFDSTKPEPRVPPRFLEGGCTPF